MAVTDNMPRDKEGAKHYSLLQQLITKVAVSNASASLTIDLDTTAMLLTPDTDCHITFVASGGDAADTNDFLLYAGVQVFMPVGYSSGADTLKVIRATADGNLYILELGL